MTVEAHILDFKGKIYDQPIRVHFVQRIRSEKEVLRSGRADRPHPGGHRPWPA